MSLFNKLYNIWFFEDKAFVKQTRRLVGFTPSNMSVFYLAFKHSSKATEIHTSNERLEFLGDAVLDTVVSEWLFNKYPFRGEGFLTELRSKIVNRKQLGYIGEQLKLHFFLDYDNSYVNINSTILGNALEALIGAIYLDAGYKRSQQFIFDKLIIPYIDLDELIHQDINYKSRLFEWAQRHGRELTFEVIKEKSVKKIRFFVVGAFIDGQLYGTGEGRSKKDAQKSASQMVYDKLNIESAMEW